MREKFNRKISSSAIAEKDLKKMQENFRFKLVAIGVLVAVIAAFLSVAWFTMSRETEGTGANMKASGKPYDIVVLENGNDGIYKRYHDLVMSDGVAVWQMTEAKNMDNYDEENDTGIKPGSFGMISFYVKPRDASVDLDLTFELVGYNCSETVDSESGEKNIDMNKVSQVYQDYLKGHILLFQNRTEKIDENTHEVTYVYSDPILSGADGKRRIQGRKFEKSNENVPVDIYWVWPNTLSTLVDARENEYVSTVPFCTGSDYNAVVNNIITNPNYYFYNYSAANDSETGEEENQTNLTEQIIASQYEIYGDLYDRADNEIGMNVNYITLKMTTAMSESNGE